MQLQAGGLYNCMTKPPACSCSCAHLVFGLFKLKKLFEYIDLISEVVLLFRTELRLV